MGQGANSALAVPANHKRRGIALNYPVLGLKPLLDHALKSLDFIFIPAMPGKVEAADRKAREIKAGEEEAIMAGFRGGARIKKKSGRARPLKALQNRTLGRDSDKLSFWQTDCYRSFPRLNLSFFKRLNQRHGASERGIKTYSRRRGAFKASPPVKTGRSADSGLILAARFGQRLMHRLAKPAKADM